MEEIQKALSLKSELDLLRPLNTEQENRIMQKFRLDWNYHSNHLEGNTLTYGETKALILFGVTAQGKPLKDTLEITGHNEAIDWVIDMVKGERPLTENFIRELHKLLLREPYEKRAISADGLHTSRKINVGSYKTTPNHVLTATGETFYFASPEETPAKMKDLMDWYNEKIESNEINPILLSAEFHYRFIRIHPFDDGNGRTARILMNFILMKFNFPPVIIRTEDKENYFGVLRLADVGNIEAFIEYIAQNLNRSLHIMIMGAKGESVEEADDLDKEIALLEHKLNNFNKKEDNKKTSENIKGLLITIENILKLLKIKSLILSKMYNSSEFEILVYVQSNRYSLKDFLANKFYNESFEKIQMIEINSAFNNFLNTNFYPFSFNSSIFFYLVNNHKYIVSLDIEEIIENKILEKNYGVNIDEIEVNEIVKQEVKRHKQFIEQKMDEQRKNLK